MTPAGRTVAVIPAYQAAATVGEVVRSTLEVIQPVVVVDDGSTDATADVARAAGARVLRLEHNLGKGGALSHAFDTLLTEGVEAVVTLDADGQHLASEIPKLLDTHERTDAWLVLGTRDHLFAHMSPGRRTANTVSSRIISRVAGGRLPDIQTGFRLYTRRLLDATGFPEQRFDAETAVVIRAVRRDLPIATVPIELAEVDGRSTSHFRPLADSWCIFRTMLRVRREPLEPPKTPGSQQPSEATRTQPLDAP